jgi:hypothetical protein
MEKPHIGEATATNVRKQCVQDPELPPGIETTLQGRTRFSSLSPYLGLMFKSV